ncbi:MAG: hypothetical protein K2H09_09050 [Treponemataceae bacterium]|nr:hypothetical protein [Treponemataceae bacterium]
MKQTKPFIAAAAALLFGTIPAAGLPFNGMLSESERTALEDGQVLIRNIDKYKNMSLDSDNEGAVKLRELIKALSPNYLAEVIQVKPYEGNEDLPEKMRGALMNISEYAGIPYWSERHERYYDLYSSAQIIATMKEGDSTTRINADLYMSPFGTIHTPIVLEQTDGYLLYTSTNNNKLKYEGITCVKEQNMKSAILLFRDGGNWILYGAGGVKAPKISFLEKRIETSFINRIKTFCNFIFTKF